MSIFSPKSRKTHIIVISAADRIVDWTLRLIVILSLTYAALSYLFDFLPNNGFGIITQNDYIRPAIVLTLACVLLYSSVAKRKIAAFIEVKIWPNIAWIKTETIEISRIPFPFLAIGEIFFCVIVAAAVVAFDITLSLKYGLLSGPPYFDGLAYTLDASRMFFGLYHGHSAFSGWSWFGFGPCAWIWLMLIMLSYHVFGQGEWQAATARFWPTLVFLINIAWVMRRRAGLPLTWAAVIISALIPFVSPCIRALAWGQFWGDGTVGYTWYQGDLRPDFLNSALLMSSLCVAIEMAKSRSIAGFILCGLTAGLALFVKVSAAPGTALAFGLAMLCTLIVNRRKPIKALAPIFVATSVFGILLICWIANGGLAWSYTYLTDALAHPEIWGDIHGTPIKSAQLYVHMMWCELGNPETITFLLAVTASVVTVIKKKSVDIVESTLLYLLVGAVFFIGICKLTSINYFLGYTCWMCLWLATLSTINPASLRSYRPLAIPAFACVYIVATILVGLHNTPNEVENAFENKQNKLIAQQVSSLLGSNLKPWEYYVAEPFFGAPQMYMALAINSGSPAHLKSESFANSENILIENESPIALSKSLDDSSAAILFDEPAQVCRDIEGYPGPIYWKGFNTLKTMVKNPAYGYLKARTFTVADGTNPPLHLSLYLRKDSIRLAMKLKRKI